MSTIVINAGEWVRDTSGRRTTDFTRAQGDAGTVTVQYEGITYVFGPGQSKSLEDGIAAALVAGDGRLRLADTREGNRATGRS